jgi:hypothetical protein
MKKSLLKVELIAILGFFSFNSWGQTFSPENEATGVSTSPTLSITFASGSTISFATNKNIYVAKSDWSEYETLKTEKPAPPPPAVPQDSRLSINGNVLTIDLSGSSLSYTQDYIVYTDPGTILVNGSNWDDLSDYENPGWSFQTESAPTPPFISTTTPADDSSNISTDTDLTITFSENIISGSGDLTIYEKGGFSQGLPVSYASITGNSLTISNSSFSLKENTDYYILIDQGFVKSSSSGVDFEGISDTTTWNFKTEALPPVWTTDYPSLSGQTASQVTLNGQTDQDGTYYYVITESETYPSAAQIAAGTDENDAPVSVSGNGSMTAVTTFNENINISGLEPGTYHIYSVASNGSKYSSVARNTLDRVPPIFSSFKPDNGSTTVPTDTVISVSYSEKLYATNGTEITSANAANYVTLYQGGTPVTCTGAISGDGKTITLTPGASLSENTSYSVSFSAFEDQYGNESEAIVDRVFTTDKENHWVGNGTITTWGDPDNWGDQNYVSGKSVVIDASATTFPEIQTGTINVNHLTIESGASLTQTGGTLNINGQLILESSSNLNASFLPMGGTLTVTPANVKYHQYIAANDRNYNIGAPVTGATQNSSGITNQIFEYDNASNSYIALGGDDPLVPGTGYICRSNQSLVFTGSPVTSDVKVDLTRNQDGGLGWNLVANPFSATVNFHKIWTDTTKVEYSFWIWDNVNGKYNSYNAASDIGVGIPNNTPGIPSHQGFWVKVKEPNDTASIHFLTSAMEENTTSYLKSTTSTKYPTLKLETCFNGKTDETAIVFSEDADLDETDIFDTDKKLTTSPGFCQVFSLSNNKKLAINGLPPSQAEISIPLGYQTDSTGTVTFSIKDNTLSSNSRVILEDKVTGNFTELSTVNSCQLNIQTTGINNNRFVLHISGSGDVTTDIKKTLNNKNYYFYTNNFEIITYIGTLKHPTFKLFNASGKLLKSGIMNSESENRIKVSGKGMFILVVESEKEQHEFKTVF